MHSASDAISPLLSLSNLLSFKRDHYIDERCRAWIPLCKRSSQDSRSRLMVCHDMAGGYLADSLFQGQFCPTTPTLNYTFQHWHHCDVFIYFAHHRVSVPPPAWTNAAHRNGVPVLGTIITEWTQGIPENLALIYGPYECTGPTAAGDKDGRMKWSKIYADRLVELADLLGFDGWFINLESPVPNAPADCEALAEWLRYLTDKMHESKSGSLVIWYDSLTVEGKIDWQDCLNGKNKPFFDATDGMFTNYTWKRDAPFGSAKTAGMSRKLDVYTGIDVFGRNTFGGGGFDCWKALEVIQSAGTSVALFAPGWTLETFGRDKFIQQDLKLWYGDSDDQGNGIGDYVTDHNRPGASFYSNFDQGFGKRIFVEGKLVFEGDWYHVGMQSISPSLGQRRKFQCYSIRNNFQLNTNNNGNHGLEWSLTNERAYNGGTCVQLLGTICDPLTENPLFTSRLFKVSIAGQSYISGWFIGNSLLGSSEAGVYIRISCDSKIIQKLISESKKENSIYSYNDEAIILLPKMAVSKELNKRYFEISVGEKFQITEIGIYVMANNSRSAEYHTNLGEIFLSTDNSDSLSSATNVAVNNLKLSPDGMLLSWDCAENGSLIDHFNVYSGDRWLGSAFAKCFKLLIAVIDQPIFRVVPVDRQGREHETKQ